MRAVVADDEPLARERLIDLLGELGSVEVVGQAARFADLVVMPKPYGPDASLEKEAILEAALFAGGAPVLVLPEGGLPDDPAAFAGVDQALLELRIAGG